MNEINNLKDEKKNLSVNFEYKFKQLNEKIELKINKESKETNEYNDFINEINKLNNKSQLIEKDNKFLIESFISNIS